jgi:integrase
MRVETVRQLTDTACRNAKPEADRQKKLSDSGGLYLLVQPTGSKLWQMAYRFDGKQKTYSCGVYGDRPPAVSLASARAKRDAAKALLSQGIDPNGQKQAAKREKEAARTFGDWDDEWLAKERAKWDAKTIAGKERWIGYLKPEFGKKRIPEIIRRDVLLFLKTFEQIGKLETRDRIRAAGEDICLYADLEGTDYNPFRNLNKQLVDNESTPRPALIEPIAVAELFEDIALPFSKGRFGDLVGYAVRFISLTAARPGEIGNAEWTEFDFDAALWKISAAKMKMEKEHVVPLSRQALAILREVRALTGDRRYVFSCSKDKPISDMTLNKRLTALGYDTATEHTAHGFRTTFSTLLNGECDRDGSKTWDGDLIELQLAHLDESSVKAIYNRTGPMSLIGARAKMMQHWADRIDTMRDGGKKVMPLRKRAA